MGRGPAQRLAGVCVPNELVWEFDDDLPQRRLRVEVVMRDLRSWEDGPFLAEMSRKEARQAATRRSAAPAAAKSSGSAAPAAAPATAAPATSASATVSTTTDRPVIC